MVVSAKEGLEPEAAFPASRDRHLHRDLLEATPPAGRC